MLNEGSQWMGSDTRHAITLADLRKEEPCSKASVILALVSSSSSITSSAACSCNVFMRKSIHRLIPCWSIFSEYNHLNFPNARTPPEPHISVKTHLKILDLPLDRG